VSKRKPLLIGMAAAVAACLALLIVLSASSGDRATPASSAGGVQGPVGTAQSAKLLAGIPERGLVRGNPRAPLTLVEYADLQCPACRMYSDQVFPELVQRYVRAGKLRIELRLQSFLGQDSVTAAHAVAAAALQNRAWGMVDLFYRNQGEENSGYVTPRFLTMLGSHIGGLDTERMLREQTHPKARKLVTEGSAAFAALGLQGTPSFQLGRTGGDLGLLQVQRLDVSEFTGPIDSLLAG
jgi:protein-disulfide isomerase